MSIMTSMAELYKLIEQQNRLIESLDSKKTVETDSELDRSIKGNLF